MLESSNVVAFVLTNDPERAKAFYSDVLGLPFQSEDPFALVFDMHGATLRVVKMKEHKPSDHTVFGWEVPDVTAAAAELLKRGVSLERYSFIEQDENGVWTAPDRAAKVGWFKDQDGNVLSISQH